MSYKNYQNARDAAWRILLDCNVERLPANVNDICRKLKIRVLSYEDGNRMIERANLVETAQRTDGMTFYMRKTPVILFNEKMTLPRAKFTVAHEIGHIILGHVKPGDFTTANREPQP